MLNQFGSYLSAGSEYGPHAVGAEQRADGGYDVVIKDDPYFNVATFYSNGYFQYYSGFHLLGSSVQMQQIESRFQQDFNGNGTIGAGSSGSGGLQLHNASVLVNYMASAFVSPAGEGAGVVAETQSSAQGFLTNPAA
jgi:hypothetical protein